MSDNEDLTLSSPTQSSTRLMNQGHANSNDKPLVFSIKPQKLNNTVSNIIIIIL